MIKVQNNLRRFVCFLLVILASFIFVNSVSAVTLGISGNRFTLDGQAKFLVLSGYWDGLDAPNPSADLNYLKSKGFDGIRIFPNLWDYCAGCSSEFTPGNNPVIKPDGTINQSRLNQLISIIDTANSLGMIVDVTFARETIAGNCQASAGNPVICITEFKNGVISVVNALKNKTNVFYDLSNEYDHPAIDVPNADIIDLKNRIRSNVGTNIILSVSSSQPSGSVAINNARSMGMNLVSVHWASGTTELNTSLYPGSIISSLPTYVGEPYNTHSVSGYTSAELINGVVEAKKAGIAAWLFHSDATFLSNGEYPIRFQSNEQGFVNSFLSALQSVTWGGGGGGGGTVPPPTSGACINPAPATSTVPDMKSVVQGVAAAHPNWLQDVCNSYDFIDEVVRQLRAGPGGTRWAYEAKRANLSDPWQEGISYYYGSGNAPTPGTMSQYEVFAIDIVHQYCGVAGGGTNTADWNVADWPYRSPNLVEVAYLYPRNAGGSLPAPQLCTGQPPPQPPPPPTGPPTITGISPLRAAIGQTVEIYGTNLVEDIKLELSDGRFYTVTGVVDFQRTTLSFTVPDAPAGSYKISITGPSGSATSPQNLEVVAGGSGFPPPLNLGVPSEGLPTDLGQLIEAIFSWSLSLIGLVIFVRFFYAGFLWFTAAGNTNRTGQAKDIMKNAIYGALILFSAWLILNTINPDLVGGGFDLPGLSGTAPTSGTGGTGTAVTCNNGVCSNGFTGPCQAPTDCQ